MLYVTKWSLLVLVIGIAGGVQSGKEVPIGPTITPVIPTTISPEPPTPTPKPTTHSTTVKPTTAPPTTTASTTAKTTTTTSTTTIKPTTITTKPTTTTTAKPTPTPKPTPPPKPVDPTPFTWMVNYTKSDRNCIVARLAIQVEVLIVENENDTKSVFINIPGNETESEGDCGAQKESLVIKWNPEKNVQDEVTFVFAQNLNSSTNATHIELDSIDVTVNVVLPGNKNETTLHFVHKKSEFSTPLSRSYTCSQIQTLNLTKVSDNKTSAYIHVQDVQIQAFRNTTGTKFDRALDCLGNQTSDVVPIAVGCVLAALVIIILVAYLYARRRSQARGYLSM